MIVRFISDDSLYEAANEIFDEVCFDEDSLLNTYNANYGVASEELFGIIDEMIGCAVEAMYECAKEHRAGWERYLGEFEEREEE